MPITILDDPDKTVRPEGAVRCDVAWKLFLPDLMGDVKLAKSRDVARFTAWLWNELSDRLGSLRMNRADEVFVLAPSLTDEASELLVRICSMWSDEVYVVRKPNDRTDLKNRGENAWIAPKANVYNGADRSPLLKSQSLEHHDSITMFLMPALGSTRSFMRTYLIRNGMTYARLHSHSAVEEHYLILKGKGTLRYGRNIVDVREGDLVSKPVGPDNFTQFVADRDSELKILDIEVWPDTTMGSKDVVLYPDHKEVFFRGQGWSAIVPSEDMFSADDFQENYDTGYERRKDGSWVSKSVPGVPDREDQ